MDRSKRLELMRTLQESNRQLRAEIAERAERNAVADAFAAAAPPPKIIHKTHMSLAAETHTDTYDDSYAAPAFSDLQLDIVATALAEMRGEFTEQLGLLRSQLSELKGQIELLATMNDNTRSYPRAVK